MWSIVFVTPLELNGVSLFQRKKSRPFRLKTSCSTGTLNVCRTRPTSSGQFPIIQSGLRTIVHVQSTTSEEMGCRSAVTRLSTRKQERTVVAEYNEPLRQDKHPRTLVLPSLERTGLKTCQSLLPNSSRRSWRYQAPAA